MTKILLTGAGFSRNWGGWLSSEAFEFLLSCSLSPETKNRLWADRDRGFGFEHTLGNLQARSAHDTKCGAEMEGLNAALIDMFDMMDKGLAKAQFEVTGDHFVQLSPILGKFDAIFSLNQDLLLERHYQPHINSLMPMIWKGATSPGLSPISDSPFAGDPNWRAGAKRFPAGTEEFRVKPSIQPYFKLHGSANWFQKPDGRLLVMGTNKEAAIMSQPLLKWYFEEFQRYLSSGGTKLMVMGYGFGDPHINSALCAAAHTGLKTFIVDPLGVDALDKRDPRAAIRLRSELMETLQPTIMGASRRDLRTTFSGRDRVELSKFTRFLETP